MTLDASAAFDKINTYVLLSKLLDKDLPFEIARVLRSRFKKRYVCIRLIDYYSDYIEIKSGIKQSGFMSPIL